MNNEPEECREYVYQFLNTLEQMINELNIRLTALETRVNKIELEMMNTKTIGQYSNITDSWFHKNYQ